eukprot:TRINITY_DN7344_c0_g2_i2.p1 TRINITY_DN7344_c0_g2~~TRINITY_DN7344_c0_g2_i2.p1  ORF type:complete len:526 (-),score=144.48 TRINITY_DN7344_c0_g2_i2:56-1633(-)
MSRKGKRGMSSDEDTDNIEDPNVVGYVKNKNKDKGKGKGKEKVEDTEQMRFVDSDGEEFDFEDPYEDELESEEWVTTSGSDNSEDEGNEEGDESGSEADDVDIKTNIDISEEKKEKVKVWRPGVDALEEDEELDYDPSVYDLMHELDVEWPCLSFQILRDNLGPNRTRFPHTVYLAAGTQADVAKNNKIMIMKISELHKTKHYDSDEESSDDEKEDKEESEDEDDIDADPILEHKSVNHNGGVNRIRSMPQEPGILSTWSETGKVHIWNVTPLIAALDFPPENKIPPTQPLHTFSKHTNEGFALDWSPLTRGRLASGDIDGNIFVHEIEQFSPENLPYRGHTGSVEDIQWSYTEDGVFASCSSDQTIRIWDLRNKQGAAITVNAHTSDVNVISWNPKVEYLLVSGGDDGAIRIWDLRSFRPGGFVAEFTYLKGPVTSVEWNPNDESQIVVGSADNQVTIWDMSLEPDEEGNELAEETGVEDAPPQLFFQHLGQEDVKECHWHSQIPGLVVSTAANGFNIFKSFNT